MNIKMMALVALLIASHMQGMKKEALIKPFHVIAYDELLPTTKRVLSREEYNKSCRDMKRLHPCVQQLDFPGGQTNVLLKSPSSLSPLGSKESEKKSGMVCARSFGPLTMRDVEHLLNPVNGWQKGILIAPNDCDLERLKKGIPEDLWSEKRYEDLKNATDYIEHHSEKDPKKPLTLLAFAAGVPNAIRLMAEYPEKFTAAFILNPLIDIEFEAKDEPTSVGKALKSMPEFQKEGEELFLKKRFNIKEWVKKIKTPLFVVHSEEHYGLPITHSENLTAMLKEEKILHVFLEIGCPRDLDKNTRDFIEPRWKNFLNDAVRKVRVRA